MFIELSREAIGSWCFIVRHLAQGDMKFFSVIELSSVLICSVLSFGS